MAEDQLRLVIKTFKQKLFTEIFPGRDTVPKTLVFAKTDLHADDIVRVIREEFGQGNGLLPEKSHPRPRAVNPKSYSTSSATASILVSP